MKTTKLHGITRVLFLFTVLFPVSINGSPVIQLTKNPSILETLAAREVMRYLYICSGERLKILNGDFDSATDSIFITTKDHLKHKAVFENEDINIDFESLASQQFLIRTIKLQPQDKSRSRTQKTKCLLIAGGDEVGALYGSYRFAETLGVRFYLHGDVIPGKQAQWSIPDLDIHEEPNFALRGILPFHDFGEGPDWWSAEDYKDILYQLGKMRMNFIGLHTYPERNPVVGPEVTVWHGIRSDIDEQGKVHFGYPGGYMTTQRGWRIEPMLTSEFTSGASQIFERDAWGSPVLDEFMTWPVNSEDCAEVFNRTGKMLNDVFSYARSLGIKTCLGTEVPLSIPRKLAAHIREQYPTVPNPQILRQGHPYDLEVYDRQTVQKVYEGTFERIKRCHPLDYYWLWTEEFWRQERPSIEVEAVTDDILIAIEAAKAVKAPFALATCGWVLGPVQDKALFDQILPKDMPFSCINNDVGKAPVEPQFESIQDRPKWAIPWLEDDPNLEGVQLWAKRMYRDAVDAYRYGCTGLMGIHWRTEILSPNISALAYAAWDDSICHPGEKSIQTSAEDFYRDWAHVHFGESAAEQIAKIFVEIDGKMPEPSYGIGKVRIQQSPWEEVRTQYLFVDELEKLLPTVQGAGNIERFNYWLNSLRYLRAMARLGCSAGQFEKAMKKIDQAGDQRTKATIAQKEALPCRIQTARDWEEMMTYLLMTVNSTGAMGTVSDLEQVAKNKPYMPGCSTTDSELEAALGHPLPPETAIKKTYHGKARIIMPTVQQSISVGERLALKVILLTPDVNQPSKSLPHGELHWRPLGSGKFNTLPLKHIARAVFEVRLPSFPAGTEAFEYYISAQAGESELVYPVTAPEINQTLVVMP